MLRAFSSIWINRAVVFLSQQKLWQDKHELVARDPTEDIQVGICGVSWLSRAERVPPQSWGCARGGWSKPSLLANIDRESIVAGA